MKHAHNKVQSSGAKSSIFLNPIWILGFICLFIGSLFNVVALGLGDQILFSITSSFSIVLNTVFSVIFLRESLLLSDFFSICIICGGSTLFLLTAKNRDDDFSAEALYANYTRPVCLIFLMSATVTVLALLLSYLTLKKRIE
jgi:hypothetical protein